MKIDPITLAVIRGMLEQIADEMDLILVRSAFSPVISEAYDRAHGIFDGDTGETIVQGRLGLPIFIGNMQFTLQTIMMMIDKKEMKPGDLYIVNSPYLGGTHLQDVKMISPFYYNNQLLFFLVNTAHWMDVGGGTPGGWGAKSTEIFQEGTQIPPIKVQSEGVINREVIKLLVANTRVPKMIEGDLHAQINSLAVGEKRLKLLIDKYQVDQVKGCIKEFTDRSEQQMRSYLAEIPDGVYKATDYVDSDGVTLDPLKVSLELKITGDNIHFDFSKSAPPCRGPFNLSESTTISACYVAMKHIFADIPINSGCFKPFTFQIPKTTFLNASPPRPVAGYCEVCQRVMDTVFKALSDAIPDKSYAGSFSTTSALFIGGVDPKKGYYVSGFAAAGGYGASKDSDGLIGGNPPFSMASIPAFESIESSAPLLFEKYAIRDGSGGAGRNRGGLGTIYELRFLGNEASATVLGDRGMFAPFGICNGKEGGKNEIVFQLGDKEFISPHITKDSGIFLKKGDRIIMRSPGGGGYGDPFEREPSSVLRDIKLDFITKEQAEKEYGVCLKGKGKNIQIDLEETSKKRGEMKIQKNKGSL